MIRVIIAQLILYYLIVIFGIITVVPMGLTMERLASQCVLYGDIYVFQRPSGLGAHFVFGSQHMCNIIVAMHCLFSIALGSLFAFLYTIATVKDFEGSLGKQMDSVAFYRTQLVLQIGVCVFLLTANVMESAGFAVFCHNLHQKGLQHCSDLQKMEWHGLDGTTYYDSFTLSIAGSWVSFALWLVEVALSSKHHRKHRRLLSTPMVPATSDGGKPAAQQTTNTNGPYSWKEHAHYHAKQGVELMVALSDKDKEDPASPKDYNPAQFLSPELAAIYFPQDHRRSPRTPKKPTKYAKLPFHLKIKSNAKSVDDPQKDSLSSKMKQLQRQKSAGLPDENVVATSVKAMRRPSSAPAMAPLLAKEPGVCSGDIS